MTVLVVLYLVCYAAVVTVVGIYGIHRYWVIWTYMRRRRRAPPDSPPDPSAHRLPAVTIQLPMFNERHVARRVIEAACAQDYPRELLQVQVLDDSTDESASIARDCVRRLAAEGIEIEHIQRTSREGFKAGALAAALKRARGELIAIFDADFVPPPDLLRRTVGHFDRPDVGMVQLRWTHLNRDDSLLTQVQAMYLDGHFVLEQPARFTAGRWFNFNGTAGIWRRLCIDDAGGWQHDTLTEDTDLSYRAQMRGWKFVYLPEVCCPAEVPPTVDAFLTQQHRWNKGLMQTAIKLLPRIVRCRTPLSTRLEAWCHLTSPFMHLAIVALSVLAVPVLALPSLPASMSLEPAVGMVVGMLLLTMGTVAACAFYVTSQCVQGLGILYAVARLPALMAIGIGISVTNSRAVLEALFRRQTPFLRTPKYAGAAHSEDDPQTARVRRLIPRGSVEVALGLAMAVCFVLALVRPYTIIGAPFLLLFAGGFLGVGLPMLRKGIRGVRRPRGAAALRGRPAAARAGAGAARAPALRFARSSSRLRRGAGTGTAPTGRTRRA
jgi:cellulose synthase/poly-beta-1,6-N-acetylglucosamine synthase-like glycosyltransferase